VLFTVILHRAVSSLKNVIVDIIYDVAGKRFFSSFGPHVRKVAHHCCGLRQAAGRYATNQNRGKGEEGWIVLSQ
jgi:hypothetical protein